MKKRVCDKFLEWEHRMKNKHYEEYQEVVLEFAVEEAYNAGHREGVRCTKRGVRIYRGRDKK